MLSCDICNKKFSFKSNLTRHMILHTGEKPFKCNLCEKSFTQQHHLERHKMIHTDEKLYSCDTCERSFFSKYNLTVHERIHTGEKPYSCDTCEKAFFTKYNLTFHKRIHTGEKRYFCDACKKSFSNNGYLTVHKRIHTGEKPYYCEMCKKYLKSSSEMSLHKKTAKHLMMLESSKNIVSSSTSFVDCVEADEKLETEEKETLDKDPLSMEADTSDFVDEKPFSCDVCNKRFESKESLSIHKYLHPGQKLSNETKAEKKEEETLDEDPIKMEAESVEVIIKEEIKEEEGNESEEFE